MFRTFNPNKWILLGLGAIVVLALLAWITGVFETKRCQKIVVDIENQEDSFFITPQDIKELLTQNGTDPLVGSILERVNLKELESRVRANKLVKNCQVYRDFEGNLHADIQQERPIARLSFSNRENDNYINELGQFLPLSKHFSAKATVVSGSFFDNINTLRGRKNADLLAFLRFIDQDPFWRSQIAHIEVDKNEDIRIIPLVGRQIVEFGTPENYEAKLSKLLIFYKQIANVKGWENFRRVSVKFKGQIVCE